MDDVLGPVTRTSSTMEALEQQLDRVKTSDSGLSQERSELEALIAQTDKAADGLKPRIGAAKVQLDQLGPPPKENEAAEAPQIAAERTRLTAIVSTLDGALKSTELVRVKATQLMSRVQQMRHGLFAANLFERSGSPLLPDIWRQIGADYPDAARQLQAVFGTWRAIVVSKPSAAALAAGLAIGVFAGLWLLIRRPLARLMPENLAVPQTYTARAAAATMAAPLFALPGVAAAGVLYYGALTSDLIYSRVAALALDLFQGALLVFVVAALARAILEPRRPAWRLVNLADAPSRSLLGSVIAIAVVYAADDVLKDTISLLILPLPFSVVLSLITSLAFAALLLRVVATPFVPAKLVSPPVEAEATASEAPLRVSRLRPRWLKLPLLAVAIAIVGAAFTGYIALSRFAAGQVVITGSAVVLVILLHLAIETVERAIISPATLLGGWLAEGLRVEKPQRRLLARTISVVLHLLLATFALPGLLLAWGFSLGDVMTGLSSAMFGFQIGPLRVSLVRILAAAGLFLGLLFATRLLQRWLQSGMLRPDKMDPGIGNSIHQGIGYAGFSLAALAAISAGGIDITNLAIVAGALSVGIGFGLQSIVNNFVSGLILLVERPIKVGDWIVLRGGGEGHVRSISVRSTEIETFDRSSLIVPNSELISNVVTNWTHRNALGRVAIKVNASYKSDPEQVLQVLRDVAKASPLAMQQPPPAVSFDNLGPDALEFSILVVVADINKAGDVKTQLRTAVHKAFAANGIEFPTPERDVYLRDLDGVKVLIARVLEERARQGTQNAPQTVDGTSKPN